eukprot:Hpha_TRINITY_DN16058_c2_g1::TRINITY_DN16058_c2_g1_i1::g.120708::m.120708/K00108/betA, CHDH; choline dehydrogenase
MGGDGEGVNWQQSVTHWVEVGAEKASHYIEAYPIIAFVVVVLFTLAIRRARQWIKLKRHTRVKPEYDFVVCGSSPAGCVLANRLVKNGGFSVLVLEAGDDDTEHDKVFYLSYAIDLIRSAVDWGYQNVTGSPFGGPSPRQTHAKVLGGGSSTDWGLYVRPTDAYLSHLEKLGAKGWGPEDSLTFITRSQNSGVDKESRFHGHAGELPIAFARTRSPVGQFGAESANRSGIPMVFDINGGLPNAPDKTGSVGVSPAPVCVGDDGRRISAASAFLRPLYKNKLMAVKTNATATRLLFEGKKVVGVEYRSKGQLREVRARKEVILSCGAVGTPELLLRSGIGPGGTVVDAAAVGKNLQDHASIPLTYQTRAGISYDPQNCHAMQHYIAYLIQGNGPLLSSITDTLIRASSKVNGLKKSWLETEDEVLQEAAQTLKKCTGTKPPGPDHLVAMVAKGGYHAGDFARLAVSEQLGKFTEGMTFYVAPVPESVQPNAAAGEVTLDGEGVNIRVGYSVGEAGLPALSQIMRLCRRIVATRRLSSLTTLREAIDLTLLKNTPGGEAYSLLYGALAKRRLKNRSRKVPEEQKEKLDAIRNEIDGDEYLAAYAKAHARAFGSSAGTCSMAPVPQSSGSPLPPVVSATSLLVNGVEGLRVADASVLPVPPTSPGCATALLVGERAAEWVLQQYTSKEARSK